MGLRTALAPATVLVALVACSAEPATVPGSTVERQVTPLVADQAGTEPDAIECDDLQAEVGATTTCTATIGAQVLELKVTTTEVDGEKVDLAIAQV